MHIRVTYDDRAPLPEGDRVAVILGRPPQDTPIGWTTWVATLVAEQLARREPRVFLYFDHAPSPWVVAGALDACVTRQVREVVILQWNPQRGSYACVNAW